MHAEFKRVSKESKCVEAKEGCGMGRNTLALCVSHHFILSFYRFSFLVARSLLRLCLNIEYRVCPACMAVHTC